MLISSEDVPRWHADVDWITATLPGSASPLDLLRWDGARAKTMRALNLEGQAKPWTWMGYVGRQVEGLAWGDREDGSILRASGQVAAVLWRSLPTDRINVSRLDIAHTFWFPEDRPDFAAQMALAACQSRDAGGLDRRRRITHVRGFGDGDTLYLGSRASDQYGRLYDKWRETGDDFYKYAWRAEIEYKRRPAVGCFRWLRAHHGPAVGMAETARQWFESRGVAIPGVDPGAAGFYPQTAARNTTDAARLDWLAVQVSPTVARLVDKLGRPAVEYALGLRNDPGESTRL